MITIGVQSALIGVLVTIAVASEALLRRRNRRLDLLFVLLAINLVLWFLASFLTGAYGADTWLRVELAIAALIPATLIQLFSDLLRNSPAGALRAVSVPLSVLVGVAALSPLGELTVTQAVVGSYVLGMVLMTTRVLLRAGAAGRGTAEAARLRYLAIGASLTTTLAISGRLPWAGEHAAAAGNLAVMLYVFFLSQVIARDRLLDLNEFIVRMVVLAGLALLFATISALLVVGLGNTASMRIFNTVVSVVILITLYEPVKEWLEARTVELFFRERYGFATTLENVRRRMLRVLDPVRMSDLVLDTLYDARRATHAAVYLLEPLGRELVLRAHRGPEPALRVSEAELPSLWHAIHHQRGPLLTEQLSRVREEKGGGNRDLLDAMRAVSADVLLPFVSGDKVLGFLALRDDRVMEPYSTEEIALLIQISEAAVIVLENSQLALRLRERDRLAAIGEMAAGLAHEIRNPLGAIKGAAEYLEPSRGGARDDAELLQVIVEEANRLNSVVSQFLDYARPFRAQLAAADLNEVVRKTAKLCEARAKDGGPSAPIVLDLDAELPHTEVDAEQLKQVILNLVLNGMEATGERATPVEVSTRWIRDRDRVEITVRDRGPGIPKETLDHLFIPFFTTKPKGTGLGLAVCQRIVTNHGGDIRVESQLGAGTQFTVRLPLKGRKGEGSITGSFPAPRSRSTSRDSLTGDLDPLKG
jgi:two-component system sensor histidine kinase HydH